MDLFERMTTYVRVVEAGRLSAAAKQLRISSGAVSRQIAALEEELRTPLLMRTTRRMAVTATGQRYYERCVRILREVEEAQAIGRGDAIAGVLKVNAPVTFGLACVAPHVHALLAKHPGMRLDLHLEDRFVDLLVDDVDVAIRVGDGVPESTEIVAHRLAAYRRVIVASPGYLKRRGEPETPEALAKHDALARASGNEAESWLLRRDEREARVWLNVSFRSNALHAVRELASSGAGVALLPAWFVADAVARGELRIVLREWETPIITVNALHRVEQRGAPRETAFIDHLRRALEAAGLSRAHLAPAVPPRAVPREARARKRRRA